MKYIFADVSAYLTRNCFTVCVIASHFDPLPDVTCCRYLSQQLGSKFDHFAECVLQPLITLVSNSAKIMATSGSVCIKILLQVGRRLATAHTLLATLFFSSL